MTGYTIIDYQPRYSTNTKGFSIVNVSVSKDIFGDVINGSFINDDELDQLIKKITEEKLKEFISNARKYYNVEKARDEEIGRVQSEIFDEIINSSGVHEDR